MGKSIQVNDNHIGVLSESEELLQHVSISFDLNGQTKKKQNLKTQLYFYSHKTKLNNTSFIYDLKAEIGVSLPTLIISSGKSSFNGTETIGG